MRRILAFILSAALLVTVFGVVSITLSAAPAEASSDFTSITFDGAQENFYESNGAKLTKIDDEHGNAAEYNTIASLSTAKPAAALMGNFDSTSGFAIKAGTKYRVSFQYMRTRVIRQFNVGFAILEKESDVSAPGTLGALQSVGRLAKLSTISSAQQEKVWNNASGEFTAEKDGYAALVLYSDVQANIQSVKIDNIVIEAYVPIDGTVVEVTYHYNDGSEPQVKEVKAGYPYGIPSRSGYLFDGWYADEDFTASAPSTVRQSCSTVYAKWTEDTRVPAETVNTYDDENISFTSDGKLTTISFDSGSSDTFCCYEGVNIGTTTGTDGNETQALHITYADQYTWQWPSIANIYDSKNGAPRFKLNKNSAYRVTFDYKVDKAPSSTVILQLQRLASHSGVTNPNGAHNTANIFANVVNINAVTDGWQTVEAVFYTNETDSNNSITLNCVASGSAKIQDFDIYIDNVRVVEELEVCEISFECNGGAPLASLRCIAGLELPVLSVPEKEGAYFEGWYLDPEFIQPLNITEMTDVPLILYARWSEGEAVPETFSTDFEAEEYSVKPYTNDGSAENITDNTSTDTVTWMYSDIANANDGNGYLYFDNPETVTSTATRWNAAALFNKDGSNFKIVAGQQYHIVYAYRAEGSSGGGQTLNIVVSEQTPAAGMNSGNVTVIDKFSYSTEAINGVAESEWGIRDIYIEATATGNAYLTFYTQKEMQWMLIDTMSITPVTDGEASVVTYYNDDGTKVLARRIGAVGSPILDADNQKRDGYVFDGWRYEDGTLWVSDVFPSEDTNLYASFAESTPLPEDLSIDWSKNLTAGFEETEEVKKFYGDASNTYNPSNGTYVVLNDPENAHSGNNYFKFDKVGHWMEQYYRRLKIYSADTPGNVIWLDPLSVYKFSYYIRVDDCSGAANLYTVLFDDYNDTGKYTVAAENYMTFDTEIETTGQWKKIETRITTGETPSYLGFVLYGGYITANIDDITVEKLKEITISFQSNGGSVISDIIQLSGDYVIEPMPPEREGYNFEGWYSDKELKNKFDFTSTIVENNIILYAKWAEIVVPEKQYKTVYNTVYVDETVEKEPEDAELDTQITIGDNDVIGDSELQTGTQADKSDNGESGIGWWIIAVIAAAVVVLAAITVIVVIAIKKKKA